VAGEQLRRDARTHRSQEKDQQVYLGPRAPLHNGNNNGNEKNRQNECAEWVLIERRDKGRGCVERSRDSINGCGCNYGCGGVEGVDGHSAVPLNAGTQSHKT
jgi:hypothetical protein